MTVSRLKIDKERDKLVSQRMKIIIKKALVSNSKVRKVYR